MPRGLQTRWPCLTSKEEVRFPPLPPRKTLGETMKCKNVTVGIAGHVDHGKTSFIKSLTGIDTDRLPEEKKRGLSIEPGFAFLQLQEFHFDFVDIPGHIDFLPNALRSL